MFSVWTPSVLIDSSLILQCAWLLMTTHADIAVGRRAHHVQVCLFVCLSVWLFGCPQHNSKTNDPKVFILLYILEMTWFGFKGQKSRSQGQ